MEIQVTQENIAKALSSVGRVASSRGTLPILSNVLIKTVDNRVSISATNLDIAITHFIGSKVKKEGSITVQAKLMHDFISSLPAGVIDMTLTDNKLSIKTDKYNSVINGMSADDFPVMPAITKGERLILDAKYIKHALQQVVIAASGDEARPVLTGVYIHTEGDSVFLAATDSYRLAQKRIATKGDVSLLIPANAIQDLLRIIGDFEGDLVLAYDKQQVLFTVGDVELVTRLIDGKYPDYQKLLPKKFTTTVKVNKSEFLNITKVSSLFARESAGSVTIDVDEETKQISINAIASQLGENTASADADVKGKGSITLNSRYILDALHACDGDEVTLSFNSKLEPCIIQDPSNKDYLHVIMPLKS